MCPKGIICTIYKTSPFNSEIKTSCGTEGEHDEIRVSNKGKRFALKDIFQPIEIDTVKYKELLES